MDVVAEYASAYGGAPRPTQPWHEMLALVVRAPRFSSRRMVETAAGAALAHPTVEADGRKAMIVAALERRAFPFDGEAVRPSTP